MCRGAIRRPGQSAPSLQLHRHPIDVGVEARQGAAGALVAHVLAEFEGGLGAPDLVHEIRCPRDEGFVHALITVVVAINVVDEGRGIPWTVSAVSQWQD